MGTHPWGTEGAHAVPTTAEGAGALPSHGEHPWGPGTRFHLCWGRDGAFPKPLYLLGAPHRGPPHHTPIHASYLHPYTERGQPPRSDEGTEPRKSSGPTKLAAEQESRARKAAFICRGAEGAAKAAAAPHVTAPHVTAPRRSPPLAPCRARARIPQQLFFLLSSHLPPVKALLTSLKGSHTPNRGLLGHGHAPIPLLQGASSTHPTRDLGWHQDVWQHPLLVPHLHTHTGQRLMKKKHLRLSVMLLAALVSHSKGPQNHRCRG